jgi:hypothetical protein
LISNIGYTLRTTGGGVKVPSSAVRSGQSMRTTR